MSFYTSLYNLCKTPHSFPKFWTSSFLLLWKVEGWSPVIFPAHRFFELELPWDLQQ